MSYFDKYWFATCIFNRAIFLDLIVRFVIVNGAIIIITVIVVPNLSNNLSSMTHELRVGFSCFLVNTFVPLLAKVLY